MSKNKIAICLFFYVLLLNIFGIHTFAMKGEGNTSENQEIGKDAFGPPRVLITSYEIIEGKFDIGEVCTLRIYLKNANKYNGAYNGYITYFSKNVVSAPGNTNQQYFEKISPKEIIPIDFKVSLDQAQYGNNNMEFVIGFNDTEGHDWSNALNIAPAILKRVEMDFKVNNLPKTLYDMKDININLTYENTGEEKIDSVQMVVEGDIKNNIYKSKLKKLNIDEQKIADCQITLAGKGRQQITIKLVYQDKNGYKYETKKKKYYINVTSIEEEIQSTNTKEKWIDILKEYKIYFMFFIIVIIINIVTFVINIIIKIRRKKSNEQ